MKDDDILLPEMFGLAVERDWHHAIQRYAREAVRMNNNADIEKYTEAWTLVVDTLREVAPGWNRGAYTVDDAAKMAAKKIKDLVVASAPVAVPDQPRPFSLEAAKRGEPLVTRDGRKARFVAHVPEAEDGHRVIVFRDGNSKATAYYDNGGSRFGSSLDLFLAPKPKRTVWVNVTRPKFGGSMHAYLHDDETAARCGMELNGPVVFATAVPIQIDDVGGEE